MNKRAILSVIQYALLNQYFIVALSTPNFRPTCNVVCIIFGYLPYILKFHHYLIEGVFTYWIYTSRYSVRGYEYIKTFERSTLKSLNKRAILSEIQYTLLNQYFSVVLSILKIKPTINVVCVLSLKICLIFFNFIIISLKEFL